jgi:glycosyltransferase involved in cell wall biosynthesis
MYKSAYVWPNAAFPFRLYYESEKVRIFIIENIQHNYEWFSEYSNKFRANDYFFVILGSHWNKYLLDNALEMFEHLNLNFDNFFVMYNDHRDKKLFFDSGFQGEVINNNCWLDYNKDMNVLPFSEKKYKAIYVGRMTPVKRHYLANSVDDLALVAGNIYGNNKEVTPPPHIYKNDKPLTANEVALKINESHCGLILSEKEGACFASSEYLLCGTPVVSTRSEGGRDYWYDDYNSIICGESESEIKDAVEFFVQNPLDPLKIRANHIGKSNLLRAKFLLKISKIFERHGVEDDPIKFFNDNFFHKMRVSHKPKFDVIF